MTKVTYKGDDVRWLCCELVGELLIVGDEMCDVNIAIVLFDEDILS